MLLCCIQNHWISSDKRAVNISIFTAHLSDEVQWFWTYVTKLQSRFQYLIDFRTLFYALVLHQYLSLTSLRKILDLQRINAKRKNVNGAFSCDKLKHVHTQLIMSLYSLYHPDSYWKPGSLEALSEFSNGSKPDFWSTVQQFLCTIGF